MPKGLRLNLFRHAQVERLIEEADHLYACEDRPAQALQKIDRVLRLDPRNVKALVVKGRIYYWLSRVKEALRCYEEAISIDPNCGEGFLERARVLYAVRQEHRRALRDVRKAVARAGRDRWIKGEALRLQGHILDALDLEHEAITSYRAALSINPKDAGTHEALGNSLLVAGEPVKALREFNKALQILNAQKNPDQLDLGFALVSKAEALNALGKHLEALRTVKTGLRRIKEKTPRETLQAVHHRTLQLARKIVKS